MTRTTPEQRKHHADWMREWRRKNPDRARLIDKRRRVREGFKRHLTVFNSRHGTKATDKLLKDMFERQDHSCAGCGLEVDSFLQLEIDHDHKKPAVRWLLCGSCNRTIGHSQENVMRLRRLADILEEYQSGDDKIG